MKYFIYGWVEGNILNSSPHPTQQSSKFACWNSTLKKIEVAECRCDELCPALL